MVGHERGDVRRETAVVPKVQNEIAPGREGAILTLTDGRQILLDSAGNGAIAKQGGSAVVKKNGSIAYQSTTGNQPTTEVSYNTMSTARGNQYQLVLADGSKVWLNAASSIRFPTAFTGDIRMNREEGLTYKQIAAEKNISVKTVEKKMSQALKHLRENMDHEVLVLLVVYLMR